MKCEAPRLPWNKMNVNTVWDNKKRTEKKGQSSVVGKERWGSFDGLGQYSTLVAETIVLRWVIAIEHNKRFSQLIVEGCSRVFKLGSRAVDLK